MSNKSKRIGIKSVITGVTIVIGVIVVCIGLYMSAKRKAYEHAKINSCRNNLSLIGLGIMSYANENDDRFPMSLEQIVDGITISEIPVCSCDDAEEGYEYVIEPGVRMTSIISPSETPMVICHHHEKEAIVLYVDGFVRVEDKNNLD